MIWMAVICLAASAAGVEVTAVTSDDMVRLVDGSGSIRIIYRNRSPIPLSDLQLAVKTERPVKVGVRPARIAHCLPADRCVFELTVQKEESTPERRFNAELILSAAHRPDLFRRPLIIDASARAASRERGWMSAGSIQVGTRSETSRVLVLTLLAALPVIALLILGWWFKRRAQRPTPGAG